MDLTNNGLLQHTAYEMRKPKGQARGNAVDQCVCVCVCVCVCWPH